MLPLWAKRLLFGYMPHDTIRIGLWRGIRFPIDLSFQTQVYLGLYERELYSPLWSLMQGIGSAVDVGAHMGLYTVLFLTRSPARIVLAFEPDKLARQQLETNVMTAGGDRSRLRIVPNAITIANSLDRHCRNLPAPLLVKVDIEGGELDLLRGAECLLRSRDVRWLIETHSNALHSECERLLVDHCYRTRTVHRAWWRSVIQDSRSPDNRWLIATR